MLKTVDGTFVASELLKRKIRARGRRKAVALKSERLLA
jgi:hypothetical protein